MEAKSPEGVTTQLRDLYIDAKPAGTDGPILSTERTDRQQTQTKSGSKRPLQEDTPQRVKHATREIADEKVTDSPTESQKKRPVMVPLTQYHDVVRFTFLGPIKCSFVWFGIKQYLPILRNWVFHLFHPISSVQQKSLLLVHGAVKSGKTTLIQSALPHLLSQLQFEMPDFQDKAFCFAYIDLSFLAFLKTPEEKWKSFFGLVESAFPGRISVDLSQVVHWHTEVKRALVALKYEGDALWFISIDRLHHLFSGLDAEQVVNMAETANDIFLDNDSPCHFVLAGSAQATFWSAMGKAKDKGCRILYTAHVITTPFEASNAELFECVEALAEQRIGTKEIIQAAYDILAPSQKTPVNLTQVVQTSARYSGTAQQIVQQAYDEFLRAKQRGFRLDNADLPDLEMLEVILNWVDGSPAKPPQLYSYLLAKRGDLFYIRDDAFLVFLAQYYDSGEKKILQRLTGNELPMDLMVFVRLVPLGQLTKESKVDETTFELKAQQFAATHFDDANNIQFKKWLICGSDSQRSLDETVNPNYTFANQRLDPTKVPWVLVIQMLRNIFGHQKDIAWQGLPIVKDHDMAYMRTPTAFNEFLRIYENCKL